MKDDYKTYISEIYGKWFAYMGSVDRDQVYSIGRDNPDGGQWCARWCDGGICYAANYSPSKSAAAKRARRWAKKLGIPYGGEV